MMPRVNIERLRKFGIRVFYGVTVQIISRLLLYTDFLALNVVFPVLRELIFPMSRALRSLSCSTIYCLPHFQAAVDSQYNP